RERHGKAWGTAHKTRGPSVRIEWSKQRLHMKNAAFTCGVFMILLTISMPETTSRPVFYLVT
ncbi:MAG: hypothetical protein MSS41_04780, partial [Collinsella sp.]|nr:hypothetical protein [Collinsella sp.]